MLKLGYFTHSNVSPSETFIFDLVSELNIDPEIELTLFGGNKQHNIKGIENLRIVSTGYAEKGYKTSFYLYKLGQILGGKGHIFKNKFQQSNAYKALNKNITPTNKPDVAYIEYGSSAVLCYKYLVANQIPFIVHVHGHDVTSATNDPIYKTELQQVYKYADAIITPSEHIKRVIVTQGCKPDKVHAIYPVTNLEAIKEPDLNLRRSIPPTVIFLGRLTHKKNPLALIYAFHLVIKQIPNAQLKILGDGELRSEVESLVSELNLSNNIKLFGVVDREIAFKNLSESNIYAQHSVTSNSGDQEGFPVSLAEAAAHALPIVSSIHSGITENIIEGKTGFLVQEYDYETMAEKIIYLIKNPTVAEQMGKAGRKHIMELCEPGRRVESIKRLLFEATKNSI